MSRVSEIGGKRVPFLRWSFWRMAFGARHLTTEWQVGDGREEALAEHVAAQRARRATSTTRSASIDEFCYGESIMINVGDEKGEILDAAIRRAEPRRLLELGTYCGYSALRTARVMPDDAHLYSIEFSPANADDRAPDTATTPASATASRSSSGRSATAARRSPRSRASTASRAGSLDFVFIDHDKDAYLPDLERIVERGWLQPGAVVVADNVKFPGAPEYRAYMREHEGRDWRTTEHETHVEYQTLLKDLVLESEYLGAGRTS